jgi:hypothetical protein
VRKGTDGVAIVILKVQKLKVDLLVGQQKAMVSPGAVLKADGGGGPSQERYWEGHMPGE